MKRCVGTSTVSGASVGVPTILPLWVMIGLAGPLAAVFALAHGRGRKRLALLALEPHLDHVRAAVVVGYSSWQCMQ